MRGYLSQYAVKCTDVSCCLHPLSHPHIEPLLDQDEFGRARLLFIRLVFSKRVWWHVDGFDLTSLDEYVLHHLLPQCKVLSIEPLDFAAIPAGQDHGTNYYRGVCENSVSDWFTEYLDFYRISECKLS